MDDLLRVDETREGVDKQVRGTTTILGRGGFSLKFIVHSRAKPCDKASSDGQTVKMLGCSGQLRLIYFLWVWEN